MAQTIHVDGEGETLEFAGEELERYLGSATGEKWRVGGTEPRFTLQIATPGEEALPEGFGPEEDWIVIHPTPGGYRLAGSNPRSVLFAVYRYLRKLGIRWVRPGAKGEMVPRVEDPILPDLNVVERASYPFRTICIEGACSRQHVIDLIDWAAKHGMNGYFIQFHHGTSFWQNWYGHEENPHMEGRRLTAQEVEDIVRSVIRELKVRGMRFERMGHGWTARAVGLPGEGWSTREPKLDENQRSMLAQIDGERDLFHGVPLNTNLCYSNPEVRKTMVQDIVSYCDRYGDVDCIHLWLADGTNNNCECPECRKARPSDYYVQLLNELDQELSVAGLDTTIVFLIYVDLLWPPVKNRIENPERFLLMFAPITRSYASSFADAEVTEGPLPDYRRNDLDFPDDVGVNIQFLRAWQRDFPGQGFDFDYHNIWPLYFDPNQYALARVLHEDIQHLEEMGLHGFNSCQVQRHGCPHNLLMQVLADALWDKDRSFEEIARDCFRASFGREWAKVRDFFARMSQLWAPMFEPVHIPQTDADRVRHGLSNLEDIADGAEEMQPLVEAHLDHPHAAVRLSWRYLQCHLQLLERMLPALRAYLNCSPDCRKRYEEVFEFLRRREEEIHPGLDVTTFIKVQRWRINEVEEHLADQSGR